jgi:hypothetical protein
MDERKVYEYILYNRYGVLRPSPGLWLTLLFQCRHVIGIGLVAMASGRGGRAASGNIDLSEFGHILNPLFVLADAPALLLLLALAARTPGAGALPRFLWRHGRLLLLLSAALYSALFFNYMPEQLGARRFADWLGLSGTTAVVAYTVMAHYLRDLFADFPAAPTKSMPRDTKSN